MEVHADGIVSVGTSQNLSAGGLCARLERPLAGGSSVDVEIRLIFSAETRSEPLRLPSRVVWCTAIGEAFQVGLQFARLGDEDRSNLEMFLRFVEDRREESTPESDDPFS